MSMGGAIYSTPAFSGGRGSDDCGCDECCDCIGAVCKCIWWTFLCPCAFTVRSLNEAAESKLLAEGNAILSKQRAETEDLRRRVIAELEEESHNLCWACNFYFARNGKGESRWPKLGWFGSGGLEGMTRRAEHCQCCALLVQFFRDDSRGCTFELASVSWGFTITSSLYSKPSSLIRHVQPPETLQTLKLYRAATQHTSTPTSDDIHMVKSQIDWRVPRSWLDTCQNHHSDSCENRWDAFFDPQSDTSGMRLVDVNKMKIFTLPKTATDGNRVRYKYAVLSYTWGGVQKTKISNPTREEIDLAPYHRQLPQTIKDAITATRKMGLDFLWVDALCIQSRVEGDEATMNADEGKQFKDMHKIYGQACFCIVAAGGESANDGLWSVVRDPEANKNGVITRQPRPAQPTRQDFTLQPSVELNNDTAMAVPIPFPGDISKCKWATRAWCLQEQLFSTRYLVFFDNQIYFQCKKCMWFEDMSLETKQEILLGSDEKSRPVLGRIKDINIDLSIMNPSGREFQRDCVEIIDGSLAVVRSAIFAEYQSIVSLYSTREMTVPGDAINAVDGVLSVIRAGMHTDILFGLPESMLDAALLWRGKDALEPRDRGTATTEASVPSWSWAGWAGLIGHDTLVEFDVRNRRLIDIEPSYKDVQSYPEHICPFLSWSKAPGSSDLDRTERAGEGQLELVNGTGLGIRVPEGEVPAGWDSISLIPGYKAAYNTLLEQKELTVLSPTHLHTLTMCTDNFGLTSDLTRDSALPPILARLDSISDTSSDTSSRTPQEISYETSPQQRYITWRHDKRIVPVGELWLDGEPDGTIGEFRNHVLMVISSARYFKTRELNEACHVYTWPAGCHLYNVLLVELGEKITVVKGVERRYTVAYRKGVGRISKDSLARMSPKLQYVRLG